MTNAAMKYGWTILLVLLVAGCGGGGGGSPSISDRVSEQENVDAVCAKVGVMEYAAERTRVYRCSWDLAGAPGRFATPCYAIVDGDLMDLTDEAFRAGFDCSHAAQVRE